MTIKSDTVVVGVSATDTQNFCLKTNLDGTMKLARKSDGSGGDVLTVDAAGLVTAPAGIVTNRLILATAQNTTSGTSVDFTGIPAWAKRITVMLAGVSTNGTSPVQIQIGSGSITASGYLAAVSGGITGVASATNTTGIRLDVSPSASFMRSGICVIELIASATYVMSASTSDVASAAFHVANGSVTLSGTLDRIRLTTVNGTDTFDAGSVNILYEG